MENVHISCFTLPVIPPCNERGGWLAKLMLLLEYIVEVPELYLHDLTCSGVVDRPSNRSGDGSCHRQDAHPPWLVGGGGPVLPHISPIDCRDREGGR